MSVSHEFSAHSRRPIECRLCGDPVWTHVFGPHTSARVRVSLRSTAKPRYAARVLCDACFDYVDRDGRLAGVTGTTERPCHSCGMPPTHDAARA